MLSKVFRKRFSTYILDSVEAELARSIQDPQALNEIKRVLYGRPETPIPINQSAQNLADHHNFDVASYKIPALNE